MSKISRFVGNLVAFASGALGTERTVFGDVTQSDTLTTNINTDFIRGWEAGLDVNGFPPKQWFNAIGYTSTQLAAYIHQMGIAEYDADQEYHIGSLCNVAGEIFASKTDTNVGNTPVTLSETTHWISKNRAATTAVTGLVELATSAETIAGTDALLAVTPSTLASFAKSLTTNGYQRFPGGLIVQWGSGTTASNGVGVLTLPFTFPTAVLAALGSPNSENATLSVVGKTVSQVTVDALDTITNANVVTGFSVMAIGN